MPISRQHSSDIVTGKTIIAAHLANEFNNIIPFANGLESAMNDVITGVTPLAGANINGDVLINGIARYNSPADAVNSGEFSYYNNTFKVVENSVIKPMIVPDGFIRGGIITNNSTDTANDLDITAFGCWDATGTYYIKTTSTLTKRSDATFVAGTNQGAWDTGTKATNTTIYVYAIANPTTGVCDVLMSNSASSPTMPSGFTYKRLMHMFTVVSGTANFTQHIWDNAKIVYVTPLTDFTTGSQSTTALDYTLTVPAGFRIQPFGSVNLGHVSTLTSILVYSPEQATGTPLFSNGDYSVNGGSTGFSVPSYLRTNTSKQIRIVASTASTIIRWRTHGYMWHGRNELA